MEQLTNYQVLQPHQAITTPSKTQIQQGNQVLKESHLQEECLESTSILQKYKPNRFKIPPQEFFKSISHEEYWAPEFISPWYYLESYHSLEEPIRKRYNQLYALAINEIFTVLENELLVPILKKIMSRYSNEPALHQCIQWFYEEEEKHSEMFGRLNHFAEPQFYPKDSENDYYLCRMASPFSLAIVNLMRQFPDFLSAWLWITVYFEERTIVYSKSYLRKDQSHINSVFREVHKLHLLEEIYHVELDEVIVDRFYNEKSPFNRRMAVYLFEKVLKSYSAPKRMSHCLGKILKSEFPQAVAQIQSCLDELPQLKSNTGYQQLYFGANTTPKTRKLMMQYPEFEKLVLNYF